MLTLYLKANTSIIDLSINELEMALNIMIVLGYAAQVFGFLLQNGYHYEEQFLVNNS